MVNKSRVACVALAASLALLVSGCSFGPSPKDTACKQVEDVVQATLSKSASAAEEVITANTFLESALNVWLDNGGLQDNLYKLLVGYSSKLGDFVTTNSPKAAASWLDYQDKNMLDIEELCGLDKNFVHSLKVSAGCWSRSGSTADLQEYKYGTWKSLRKDDLQIIDLCDDPAYPWGAEFRISRYKSDDLLPQMRVVFKPRWGDTYNSGKSEQLTCTRYVGQDVNEFSFDNDWCE